MKEKIVLWGMANKIKIVWLIAGALVSFLCFIVLFWVKGALISESTTLQTESLVETISAENESTQKIIVVDIKGEVNKPGVYEIAPHLRLYDVVQLAGGFTEQADTKQINLAQQMIDEMVIIVPNKNEEVAQQAKQSSGKINLNTANKEELMKIEGIGEKKALAIIDYRQTKGKFKTIQDLKQIKGFSTKLIDTMKEVVIVQ